MMAVQLRRASAKPLAEAMHRSATDVGFVHRHSDFRYRPVQSHGSFMKFSESKPDMQDCWI